MTEDQILIRIKAIAEMGDARMAQAEIKKLAVAMDAVEGATGKAGKGTRNMGLAALEASRGFEDLQFGVRGILNNIPTLVMNLGGTAGIAAAASLAAVSLSILIPKLGLFGAESEEAKKAAKDAAEALQKLQEKAKAAKEELAKEQGEQWARDVQLQIDAIDLHSQALAENISYLKARAVAEKAMVDAQAALAMAKVDARAATDPRYSDVQQLEDKAAIEESSRRRLAEAQMQEQDLKLRGAMDKVEIATIQAQTAESNAAYFQRQEQETRERIDALKLQLRQKAADIAAAKVFEQRAATGENISAGMGGAMPSRSLEERQAYRARAAELVGRADAVNQPAIEAEIAGLEQLAKEAKAAAKKATDSLASQSKALDSASQALAATTDEVNLAKTNILQVYEVRSQAESIKTTTSGLGAAMGSLGKTAQAIDADVKAAAEAAGGAEIGLTRTQAEVKAAALKIKEAVADGVITTREMQDIQAAIAKAQANQSTLSRQTIQLLERNRADMEALQRRVNALETRPTN